MRKFFSSLLLLFGVVSLCDAQLINSNVLLDNGVAYIVSIDDASPQSVAYNTAFGSLTLPSTRTAHLSDGNSVTVSITWSSAGYSATSPGVQTVFGDPTVPSPIVNPFLARSAATVTVQEQVITTTFTAPTGFSTWEVPAGVDTITYARFVGGGGTGGSLWNIGSASGGGGGGYSESVTFPVTAGELVCVYIAPQKLGPLPTSTDLDGLDGDFSQFGPAAPAGSTILSGAGAPGGGTGADGNYYFDTATGNFYGPKVSGAWGSPVGTPYVKAAGGKKGIISGAGGDGGAVADGLGNTKHKGGNGTTNAASRSGAGGGAAGITADGGDGQILSGTNVQGGTGIAPGGNGGNGSSGTAISGATYGGAGGGARNTSGANPRRGGIGEQGWGELRYSGATVPPVAPGNVYLFCIEAQSGFITPGNGPSAYPGPHDAQMWINSTTGFQPLQYGVNQNANSGNSLTNLGPECGLANALAGVADGEIYFSKKCQSATSMFNQWNVSVNGVGVASTAQNVDVISYLEDQGKIILKVFYVFRQGEADIGGANPWGTATYLYGTGAPSSGTGAAGNVYIDKNNNLVWGIKSQYGNTNWGTAGFTLYNATGSGAPSSGTSTIGACYWDSVADQFYIKTDASTWTSVTEQDAVVRAGYLGNYYKLIKYKIDRVELQTNVDYTVTEFMFIDCVIDNPTTADATYRTSVIAAKYWGMGNFDADNAGYAAKTAGFGIVSCSSCLTMDGVHLSTVSVEGYGASIFSLISIP